MARKNKGWKTALIVGLSALTVVGAATAAFTLIEPSKTKELGKFDWSVGSINADGVVSKADKYSIVSDAFGCDGLKVDIAENEFKGIYGVYFYTLKGHFISSIENLSTDKDEEDLTVPLGATCRIVYKPQLDEGDKIYFWEVGGFADDLLVTYNRTQESVLDKSKLPEDVSGNVYSMIEYNGTMYAGVGGDYLLKSTNGSDWSRVGNDPCTNGQISQLVVYNDILYGVNTNKGVFSYAAGEDNFILYEGEYENSGDTTATNFSLHHSGIRSLAVLNGKLIAFGESSLGGTAGAMVDGAYKRVNVARSNVYMMTDPGCWVALTSPGDAVSFNDAVYVDGKYIFVGDNGSVFATSDLDTWYDYSNADYGNIQSVYHDGQNFVFGGANGAMYVGATIEYMQRAYTNSTMATESVRMIEGFDGSIYAVAYSANGEAGELWKSDNHGANWRVIVASDVGLYSLCVMRGMLYVGGVDNIFYLGDI